MINLPNNFTSLFPKSKKPIIGMIHLPPLPGSANNELDVNELTAFAHEELTALVNGGIDAVIIENFHDYPFYPETVEPATLVAMAIITHSLVLQSPVPIGVNILRNACPEALSIAAVTRAAFIRCNIWTGAYVTDQGLISGCAHIVKRLQKTLGTTSNSSSPSIFADVHCKHASPISNRPLNLEVDDALNRGAADAVIITGEQTGLPTKLKDLKLLSEKNLHPIIIGSGLTIDNLDQLLPYADGAIVGTSLKKNGVINERVDITRVKALIEKRNLLSK